MTNYHSESISIRKEAEYTISIVTDLFDVSNTTLADIIREKKIFIVLDDGVGAHIRKHVDAYLSHHGIRACMRTVRGGEVSKKASVAESVARDIVQFGLDRGEYIVAIGGGATLDMTGYVASRVHRGIPHINIPTTFLAQVDAGVGVKNGINFHGYKNTLGSFYPPRYTIVDPMLLSTLSTDQIRSGLAESIKVSILLNWRLFEVLERYYNDVLHIDLKEGSMLWAIIRDTIFTHVRQIETDPFEMRKERPLVFGHQWGHWLEIKTKNRLSHGEAISIGIALDSHIALQRGLITEEVFHRIFSLLQTCGLPIYDRWIEKDSEAECRELFRGLKRHQEHQYGGETLIALPKGKGDIEYVSDITLHEVRDAVQALVALKKR